MGDRREMVNTDDIVSALLTRHPRVARVLVNHGMHCVGCAIGRFEAQSEACAVYRPEAARESENNA